MKFPSLWNKKSREKNFSIRMSCISHTGNIRMKNQDNFFFCGTYLPMDHLSMEEAQTCLTESKDNPIVAVFDGMGGECAGELASYTAAKALAGFGYGETYSEENLTAAVLKLNQLVCNARHERRLAQIGSTMVLLAFQEECLWVGNLGDSPAFRLRKGKLERLSQPHTNAKFLEEQGIKRKPGLTQFLGIDEEEFIQEPYLARIELRKDDMYLLCSDGLTDMVPEEEIRNILKEEKSVEEKVKSLLNAGLEYGGRDNITMILCQIGEEGK